MTPKVYNKRRRMSRLVASRSCLITTVDLRRGYHMTDTRGVVRELVARPML